MRKALLAVEALPLTANTPISIPGYGTGEVMYHVGLLYDHGFVKGLKIPLRGHTVYHPDGLTASGHECLDSIRDEGVWEKAKAITYSELAVSRLRVFALRRPICGSHSAKRRSCPQRLHQPISTTALSPPRNRCSSPRSWTRSRRPCSKGSSSPQNKLTLLTGNLHI